VSAPRWGRSPGAARWRRSRSAGSLLLLALLAPAAACGKYGPPRRVGEPPALGPQTPLGEGGSSILNPSSIPPPAPTPPLPVPAEEELDDEDPAP